MKQIFNRIPNLTHWGRVMHICISKLTIVGSDNGLSPDWRQAIIWTNAGILLIGPLGTNFSEILIEILAFSLKKMRLKVPSAKRQPFCLCLNVLTRCCTLSPTFLPFCFSLVLKLLSRCRSQILHETSRPNELLNTHKIPIDSQCNDGYPGSWEKLGEVLKNDTFQWIPSCIIIFGHCQLQQVAFFAHNSINESCIKVKIPICGWYQAISSKSKGQIWVFSLCFPDITYFLPVACISEMFIGKDTSYNCQDHNWLLQSKFKTKKPWLLLFGSFRISMSAQWRTATGGRQIQRGPTEEYKWSFCPPNLTKVYHFIQILLGPIWN